MPQDGILTPIEASRIAFNSYFALKGWVHKAPVAGPVEGRRALQREVLGAGATSLRGTELGSGQIVGRHTAQTGFGVTSGFGYTLRYQAPDRKIHAIIATRGTRPEFGNKADLLTDARGSLALTDAGPVHRGFKATFDSLAPSLANSAAKIADADVFHCVGHSLGGAVATLVAASLAGRGKRVRLYTFGSPRVGWLNTFRVLEERIGKDNIFRVAHDLDPITLVGPFPYIHVLPQAPPVEKNNMTIPSPSGRLISIDNHDMQQYVDATQTYSTWKDLQGYALRVKHDNGALANWLLYSKNPSWVRIACAQTLSLLLKLFAFELAKKSTAIVLGLTALDLLAEVLTKGTALLEKLGKTILKLLGYAAKWAGLTIAEGARFTAEVIAAIKNRMESTLLAMASRAVTLAPPAPIMDLGLGTSWALASAAGL